MEELGQVRTDASRKDWTSLCRDVSPDKSLLSKCATSLLEPLALLEYELPMALHGPEAADSEP